MPGWKKKILEGTEPVKAMKICGPITLGNQKITKKCLSAVGTFKAEHKEDEKIKEALRHYLYKDIEYRLVVRKATLDAKLRQLSKEIKKITPLRLQRA